MCLEMCMGQLEGFFQLNSTHHMYENQPNQLESGWLVSCALHVSCLILKKKWTLINYLINFFKKLL